MEDYKPTLEISPSKRLLMLKDIVTGSAFRIPNEPTVYQKLQSWYQDTDSLDVQTGEVIRFPYTIMVTPLRSKLVIFDD